MRCKIGIGKGEVLVLRIFKCYGSYIGDGQMLAICNINLFMSNIWLGLIKTVPQKSWFEARESTTHEEGEMNVVKAV